MNEHDPLRPLLREWEAPDPPAALDARVRAAFRQRVQPPWWRAMWSVRLSIPAPLVVVALLLLAVGVWLRSRPEPSAQQAPASPGYVTRMESAGFQPLPDGATRVIRSGEGKP